MTNRHSSEGNCEKHILCHKGIKETKRYHFLCLFCFVFFFDISKVNSVCCPSDTTPRHYIPAGCKTYVLTSIDLDFCCIALEKFRAAGLTQNRDSWTVQNLQCIIWSTVPPAQFKDVLIHLVSCELYMCFVLHWGK